MKYNKEIRKLDFSKIKFSDKVITFEESLKDVIPIQWSEEVLSKKKKVIVK